MINSLDLPESGNQNPRGNVRFASTAREFGPVLKLRGRRDQRARMEASRTSQAFAIAGPSWAVLRKPAS